MPELSGSSLLRSVEPLNLFYFTLQQLSLARKSGQPDLVDLHSHFSPYVFNMGALISRAPFQNGVTLILELETVV